MFHVHALKNVVCLNDQPKKYDNDNNNNIELNIFINLHLLVDHVGK